VAAYPLCDKQHCSSLPLEKQNTERLKYLLIVLSYPKAPRKTKQQKYNIRVVITDETVGWSEEAFPSVAEWTANLREPLSSDFTSCPFIPFENLECH